jgi:hypothetical protein
MSSFDALFALKHDVITHVMLNKSAYTDGFRYDAANRAVKRIALTRRQRRRSGRKNHIG